MGGGYGEECRLYSVNMHRGLDYLKLKWIILFCWLLKLAESDPRLLQVCQIVQLILCSRHWIHDPLQLKAGLGPLSAYGAFDTLCDGLSTPVRWSLGKALAGYPVGAHGATGWLLPQGQVTAWLQFMYMASEIATNISCVCVCAGHFLFPILDLKSAFTKLPFKELHSNKSKTT